jgi:hypothetical protein
MEMSQNQKDQLETLKIVYECKIFERKIREVIDQSSLSSDFKEGILLKIEEEMSGLKYPQDL